MAPLVSIEDLTVHYGLDLALDHVDLDIAAASSLAVIGPNGSGKSTLLRAVAGLVAATSGAVRCGGTPVALVLQSTDVDPALPITVRETVRMARYATRGPFRRLRAEDHLAVDRSLERLDIVELADRQLHDLSGGQRQRVLVAQGLAQEADVLLLDEPATGLDLVSREAILEVVADERSAGRAVVMTTHVLDDARRCDRVVLLATRVVAQGAPETVLVEDRLREAFGGRVLLLAGGELLVDDPHHAH